MKKLILLTLLIPSIAFGEFIPSGCYVSYSNPGYCHEVTPGSLVQWIESSNANSLVGGYGQIVATMIGRYVQEIGACNADYNTLLAKSNTDVDDYNRLLAQYTAQAKKIASLNKQIKKLKNK